MDRVWQDVRYTLRTLSKKPTFLAVAMITLGLAICFNTTVFSFLNTLVLRPFPFEAPEDLMRLRAANMERRWGRVNVCPVDMHDIGAESKTLAGLTYFDTMDATLTGRGDPVPLRIATTSVNFFSVLGIEAGQGRTFLPEEGQDGNHQVVVLNHKFWRNQLGSDPDIVGQTLLLDGLAHEVVGVAPASFEHPTRGVTGDPVLWKPHVLRPDEPRGRHWAKAVGRRAPGVSAREVLAELDTLSLRYGTAYPQSNAGWRIYAEPLNESETRVVRPALNLLFATVGAVLLIACLNLANLLLARGLERRSELAVRTALGASRGDLVRQMLIESLLIAGLGGLLGLILAPSLIRFVSSLGPENLPRLDQVAVDGKTLGFSILLSILTGLIFGLGPALRLSRLKINNALKEGGRETTGSGSQERLRGALVISQLTFSVVLLVASGLLLRSFLNLTEVDPGLEPDQVLSLKLSLTEETYPEDHQVHGFFQNVVDRLASVPGARSAGAVNALPFTSRYSCRRLEIGEKEPPPSGQEPCAHSGVPEGDYFATLGIELRQGRLLTTQDQEDSQPVAVINETAARRFWPAEDPIGKRFRWLGGGSETPWVTIVGMVEDIKHRGLEVPSMAEIYTPSSQSQLARTMHLVVRADGDPVGIIPDLRRAIWSIDPNLPIFDIQTMRARISASLGLQRISAGATSAFATLALLLAVLGLSGIISYLVAQRRHEFGLRMALGAEPGEIRSLVIRKGLRLAAIGLGLGFLIAAASGSALRKMLYGVTALDPVIFAVVGLVITGVTVLACYLPAKRASNADPMSSLRFE